VPPRVETETGALALFFLFFALRQFPSIFEWLFLYLARIGAL